MDSSDRSPLQFERLIQKIASEHWRSHFIAFCERQDLFQVGMIACIRACQLADDRENGLLTYVAVSARNAIRKYIKTNSRVTLSPLEYEPAASCQQQQPVTHSELVQAIQRLDEQQRTIILLLAQGHPKTKVAKMLSLSRETIRTYEMQSLRLLALWLGSREQPLTLCSV